MARILYIAMSCGPSRGSEDAIGWNLPLAMSQRGNDVLVLTRADKREEIEDYLAAHPDERGPEYLYESQTPLELKMNGPLLSAKVASWCKRVSKKIPSIIEEYRIEIVHQITPIEFRSVIDTDLSNVAMFLGPIGGAERALPALASYLEAERLLEFMRRLRNRKSAQRLMRLGTLDRFDGVWCANTETRDYLKRSGIDVSRFEVLTEIGVSNKMIAEMAKRSERLNRPQRVRADERLHLVYVGRLVPRKGVSALLDACSSLRFKGIPFELDIYGDGPQRADLERKAAELDLAEVRFRGVLPHSQIEEAYRNADAMVMPSVRETGGAVLAEAAAFDIPVIAFDAFGARVVLQGSVSVLVNPADGVDGFASAIEQVARNGFPDGKEMFDIAQSLAWNERAAYFQKCYRLRRCVPLSKGM